MPIISESSSDPARVFDVRKGSGSTTQISLPDGRVRAQTGFRSRNFTKEEESVLTGASISGNVLSVINELDKSLFDPRLVRSYANHKDRVWPVNDRDYTETRYKPTGFTTSYRQSRYSGGVYVEDPLITTQGCLGISGTSLTAYMPSMPSGITIENIAGEMLRNSRPPKAGFDLARFAGEQREAPLLFRMSNYMPRSKKDLGGAVLNFLFGIKPTGSDLGSLAELVLSSDKGLRQMISAEKVREQKSATRVLYTRADGGTWTSRSSNTTSAGSTINLGPATVKYCYLVNTTSGYSNILTPVLRYSYTIKQLVRVFATWEYFVPKPAEIESRLDSYKEKAKTILGAASVDETTVYELSPWTWLGDWFVDFGGLLRYQRDVVDNQIVATQTGYSTWEEFGLQCHYTERTLYPPAVGYPYPRLIEDRFAGVQASVQWRRHKRRGGNPYSIGPTWSLNNQQWAILGALGLSRGIDLPNRRG